jgi:hypothetical protein
MKLETIMLQLVGGTVMRGSIDKTLQRRNAYDSERRLGTANSHGTKRVGEGERALLEGMEA